MGDPRGFLKHERRDRDALAVEDRLKHHDEHYIDPPDEMVQNQASRCMDCGVPYCMSGCPLGNLIPEWNDHVYKGDWREAIRRLHATNNFPEFTGRICPAPCENSCTLGIIAPAVTIKMHEVEIADHAWEHGWIKPQRPAFRTGKRVAVVGSGPAGLACAQQLNRAGHRVTVFEKNDRAGGLLMYGIPHYKLRKETVQRRVDQLAEEEIEFRFSCEVGVDVDADELRKEYDAVVLATGAENPRDLPAPGRELDGVHFAMEFLPQSNRHNWGDEDVAALHPERKKIWAGGKKVIVIGGGDTGSDCIGTSLRQGATSVENFELLPRPPDRRTPENPWPQWARVYRESSSMEEMFAAGGKVHYAIMTKEFLGENGKLKGLRTVDLEWKGRKFEEIAGSEREWEVDLVLLAMGFLGPRQGLVEQFGCETDQRSNVVTDPTTRMTSVDGVFAAGDCRRGQSLVVWALAEGREIANKVDAYLMEEPSLLPSVRIEPFNY